MNKNEVQKPNKQLPPFFPVTDCVNAKPGNGPKQDAKIGSNQPKKLSKLQQITAMSVAIPFAEHDENVPNKLNMDKSSSIEVSMDRCNFDYSVNGKSKISGPLRESELLDFNRKQEMQKSLGETEIAEFMQSQEKRLSKMSGMDSGAHPNAQLMQSQWHNPGVDGISEQSMESSPQYDVPSCDTQDDAVQEEPQPMQYVPKPQSLVTSYKEVRDQVKWNKANNVHSVY